MTGSRGYGRYCPPKHRLGEQSRAHSRPPSRRFRQQWPETIRCRRNLLHRRSCGPLPRASARGVTPTRTAHPMTPGSEPLRATPAESHGPGSNVTEIELFVQYDSRRSGPVSPATNSLSEALEADDDVVAPAESLHACDPDRQCDRILPPVTRVLRCLATSALEPPGDRPVNPYCEPTGARIRSFTHGK